MDGREGIKSFRTQDGVSLYYKNWSSHDTAPCILYLHGLESHLGWFSNLAEFLNKNGMNIYAFDRRGSGLNKTAPGNFSSHIFSDVKSFIDIIKKEHPDSPLFLIGLCLGGKVAVNFFSLYPNLFNGLILMSPSLKNRLKFSLFDKLTILLAPRKSFKVPIEDDMFTQNRKYLDYIGKDPARLRYVSGRFLLDVANMDRSIKHASRNIKLPTLLMLSGVDKIIDTDAVKRWFEKLPSGDKTIKVYKGYHHILTFEEKAEEVMEDIVNWICMRAHAKSITS